MSVYKRKDRGTWIARVTGADGKRHSRSFSLKSDADKWEREELRKAERGEAPTYTKRDAQTVGRVGDDWLTLLPSQGLKPKTIDGYERLWKNVVRPHWGARKPRTVQALGIRDWLSDLTGAKGQLLSKSRRRQAQQVLALVLDEAVARGLIAVNPARDVIVTKALKATSMTRVREHRYLTPMELRNLSATAGLFGDFVFFLGVSGLRFGEAVALTVGDLDGNKVSVTKSISEVNGKRILVSTKSGKSRTVVLPQTVVGRIKHLTEGRANDDLLFVTTQGAPIRHANFRRRVWVPALEAAGLEGLRIHDLRGTAASIAVASGANVKSIQAMLGHSSAAMTLDQYAGLFPDHLSEVADRMDDLLGESESHQNATNDVLTTLKKIDL